MKLPNRVFRSPLIRFATFDNGGVINLIRINKPYANGNSYAIHSTIIDNAMFKTYDKALKTFNDSITNYQKKSKLTTSGLTGNAEQF